MTVEPKPRKPRGKEIGRFFQKRNEPAPTKAEQQAMLREAVENTAKEESE